MQGLKVAILAIFQKVQDGRYPVSAAQKKPSLARFCFLSSYEFLELLKGKIRKGLFFRVPSGKITVCIVSRKITDEQVDLF